MQHRPTGPILIIGHDILALGLAAMLRSRGLRVIVRDGAQDNALLLSGPRPAALVIDLMVARRDDFAILRRVRAAAHLAGLPVLVLSPGTVSRNGAELEGRLRDYDARPLLTPHDLDSLLAELERSLISVA